MKLSRKHGVNPSLEKCWFCGKDKGVVLFGALRGDAETPRSCYLNQEPCDECKNYMKEGVILLQVKDEDPNYRLGGFVVLKDEAVERIFGEKAPELLKKRAGLVANELWEMIFGGEK